MTTTATATYTPAELRSIFSTRRGTPESVIQFRAEAARRLGIGAFSPEALERHARNARWEKESLAEAMAMDEALQRAFSEGRFKVLVGVSHPTPLSALDDGQGILCTHDCCNGVLPTPEQNHLDIVRELNAQLHRAWRKGNDEEADAILETFRAAGLRPE